MRLEVFYIIPVIVAICIICIGIYVSNFDIVDTDINSFVSKANEMKDQAENTRKVFEDRTTQSGISAIISEIPIIGQSVEIVKFISSVLSTLRSGVDLTIGFFSDVLSSEVLGIPSSIIALIISSFFVAFGFAIFRTIKGSE